MIGRQRCKVVDPVDGKSVEECAAALRVPVLDERHGRIFVAARGHIRHFLRERPAAQNQEPFDTGLRGGTESVRCATNARQ